MKLRGASLVAPGAAGRGTAARKRHIAEAMKNLGFMQGFGGIETARGALAENGNPSPEF